MIESSPFPHFSEREFELCTPSCHNFDMSTSFMLKLERIREIVGFPIILNSAYRSSLYEKEHGRSGKSYHCSGRAVDIRCTDSISRAALIDAAFEVGLHGIGIGYNFLHLDDRMPPSVIWLY